MTTTGIFNICGTLLVDLHPHCPSTVSASSNLVRCSLSAAGLAVLQVIIDHIGIGWCFTLFAAIAATTIPLLLAERKWGMTWRANRDRKGSRGKTTLQQEMEEGINASKNGSTHAAGDAQGKLR
jgi:hypothetical protein